MPMSLEELLDSHIGAVVAMALLKGVRHGREDMPDYIGRKERDELERWICDMADNLIANEWVQVIDMNSEDMLDIVDSELRSD